MQDTPPPQLTLGEPSKVAAKYGDGPDIWGQTPNQAQYQAQYQVPIQAGMGMGQYPTTNATVALVLSVLGIVGCSILTAIPGLIMANTALKTTNSMPGHPDSGTAKAAQVIAWISIGFVLLGMLIYGFLIVLFIATGEY